MSITFQTYSLVFNLPLVGNFLQHRVFDPLLDAINKELPNLSDWYLYNNSFNEINHTIDLVNKNVSLYLSSTAFIVESFVIIFFTACIAGIIPGGIAAFFCIGSLIETIATLNRIKATKDRIVMNFEELVRQMGEEAAQLRAREVVH